MLYLIEILFTHALLFRGFYVFVMRLLGIILRCFEQIHGILLIVVRWLYISQFVDIQ